MTKITGDEPATPYEGAGHPGTTGLTIRQLFAMAAMQGILASNPLIIHQRPSEVAVMAVGSADALINQLNKEVPNVR